MHHHVSFQCEINQSFWVFMYLYLNFVSFLSREEEVVSTYMPKILNSNFDPFRNRSWIFFSVHTNPKVLDSKLKLLKSSLEQYIQFYRILVLWEALRFKRKVRQLTRLSLTTIDCVWYYIYKWCWNGNAVIELRWNIIILNGWERK